MLFLISWPGLETLPEIQAGTLLSGGFKILTAGFVMPFRQALLLSAWRESALCPGFVRYYSDVTRKYTLFVHKIKIL